MTPRFDPTRAVVFDWARGQLRDDEGASRLNLPASLVLRLLESAGASASRDFAFGLGTELGRRISDRLGKDAERAPLSAWAEHLGGQLALLGLGDLQLDRWGRALVLRVVGAPSSSENVLTAVFEGVLQRGLGRSAEVVAFTREGNSAEVHYLVLSAASAVRARELREAGSSLGQVIETLHVSSGSNSGVSA